MDLVHRRDWTVLLSTPDAALGDRRLVDLRMAVRGARVAVCSAIDGPDIDEKLLEPLNGLVAAQTAPVEDAGAARAAGVHARWSYHGPRRKRAAQDAEFVETLRLARDVAAAQHDAAVCHNRFDDANRTASTPRRWVVAAHRTTAHLLLADDDEEENLLDLATSPPRTRPAPASKLAALGAERAPSWPCGNQIPTAMPARDAASRRGSRGPSPFYWRRRDRASAACYDAPRKEGAPRRYGSRSKARRRPRSCRGPPVERSRPTKPGGLLALLQADPHAAADDGSLLQLACEKGYLDLAAALLSHGGVLGQARSAGSQHSTAAEAGDRALCARVLAAAARAGGERRPRHCSRPGNPRPLNETHCWPEKLLKKLAAAGRPRRTG